MEFQFIIQTANCKLLVSWCFSVSNAT